jgi:Winged helix DNA-binding domain
VKGELIDLRLRNQRLTRSEFRDPADLVEWLGAVQSQDYPAAKWGVALRTPGLTSDAFDRVFDEGRILRTHILRPTWHFVPRADIRWMLSLSAPRVHAMSASYFRKLELDGKVVARSQKAFVRALEGGRHLTRTELAAALARASISAKGQRLAAIVFHAELDQLLCSGPRRGKQFTYMLLAERAPGAGDMDREAALAELTRRFFRSHGPATIRDFVWWSGLRVREAKEGVAALGRQLVQEKVGELTYWMIPSRAATPSAKRSVYLLPNYDEYLIAYKDRGHAAASSPVSMDAPRGFDIYAHFLVVDGRFGGTWRRADGKNAVRISTTPFQPFTGAQTRALSLQAARMSAFLGVPAEVTTPGSVLPGPAS